MRRGVFALAAALPFVVACSDDRGPFSERIGEDQAAIINGIPDTTHDAVVALFGSFSGCSGTVIEANASGVYVVTAAHCFEQDTIQQVVVGDNYQAAEDVLDVVDWQQHPQWNPNDLAFDFAVLRASGGFGHPVLPVLTPAEDTIGVGEPLTHVGYGLLSSPNGSTTSRHYGNNNVSEVAQIQIAYAQPTTGPCSGDSGGASIVDLGGGERLAGVISFGDPDCAQYGVSGRVSSVYDWLVAFIGTAPSSSAASTTVSSAESSAQSTGVGGASSSGVGAGGAGASSDIGWVAGDAENKKHKGEVVSSCASAPAQDGGWGLGLCALGVAAALAMARRRRG
jgi:hypothetical protein